MKWSIGETQAIPSSALRNYSCVHVRMRYLHCTSAHIYSTYAMCRRVSRCARTFSRNLCAFVIRCLVIFRVGFNCGNNACRKACDGDVCAQVASCDAPDALISSMLNGRKPPHVGMRWRLRSKHSSSLERRLMIPLCCCFWRAFNKVHYKCVCASIQTDFIAHVCGRFFLSFCVLAQSLFWGYAYRSACNARFHINKCGLVSEILRVCVFASSGVGKKNNRTLHTTRSSVRCVLCAPGHRKSMDLRERAPPAESRVLDVCVCVWVSLCEWVRCTFRSLCWWRYGRDTRGAHAYKMPLSIRTECISYYSE